MAVLCVSGKGAVSPSQVNTIENELACDFETDLISSVEQGNITELNSLLKNLDKDQQEKVIDQLFLTTLNNDSLKTFSFLSEHLWYSSWESFTCQALKQKAFKIINFVFRSFKGISLQEKAPVLHSLSLYLDRAVQSSDLTLVDDFLSIYDYPAYVLELHLEYAITSSDKKLWHTLIEHIQTRRQEQNLNINTQLLLTAIKDLAEDKKPSSITQKMIEDAFGLMPAVPIRENNTALGKIKNIFSKSIFKKA